MSANFNKTVASDWTSGVNFKKSEFSNNEIVKINRTYLLENIETGKFPSTNKFSLITLLSYRRPSSNRLHETI